MPNAHYCEPGAMGYIMKQEGTEKVVSAIRRILDGRVYVSDDMDSRILRTSESRGNPHKPASPLELLSDRRLQNLSNFWAAA